jgi:tRNA 2-selenouridine synthase
MRNNSTDYRDIFLHDVPLMDVRAPVEFDKGAFPLAINRPLMNDSERERIGTCYKQHGQQAAIELGHQLVSGTTRQQRIEAWAEFADSRPAGLLYCFRGGLRSQITQQWLKSEAGIDYPRVIGGYKALRSYLIDVTDKAVAECDFVLIGGLTGSGKTQVLTGLPNALDLEGHANHRGSSFGKHATPQPAQISFENALAIDILKKCAQGENRFVLEDEGRVVGSRAIPLGLFRGMQHYPMVWLEESFERRVERILQDYVIDLCAEFIQVHGIESGFVVFSERLRESLFSILKRLGGERYQRLAALMDAALVEQEKSGGVDLHRAWISGLLGEYYDPMYAFQRDSKGARIEFAGDHGAVMQYLQERRTRNL